MAGLYDLMLLVDPTAPEERRNAAVSEAESMINSGGELVASHDWGTRRMAYEIDHRPEADYRLYQFNGDNALLERLNQRLRIIDGVLRFRIIKVKPGQPTPPPPDQQAPRRREEREAQDTKVAARAAADAPATGEDEYAAVPAGATDAGADEAGASPAGADPVGADPVGAEHVGADPVAADPLGADPVGTDAPGADPGTDPAADSPAADSPTTDSPAPDRPDE